MSVDTSNLKTGFWLGLGLLLAVGLWSLVSFALSKAIGNRNG
jgi:hypothetical protein